MAELIIGAVALGLAGPPLIKPIVDSVQAVRALVQHYQSSEPDYDKILVQLDSHLFQIVNLVHYVEANFNLWDQASQSLFARVLNVLQTYLTEFQIGAAEAKDKDGSLRKLDFVFRGRKRLMKLNADLRDWERSFYDAVFSVFLAGGRDMRRLEPGASRLMMENGTKTDNLLNLVRDCLSADVRRKLLLREDEVDLVGFEKVDYSQVMHSPTGSFKHMIELHKTRASDEDTREIAMFLSSANPRIVSVLPCEGFRGCTFKYRIPEDLGEPNSLRKALLDQAKHTLDERLSLMRKIASAVLYVHTAGHIHKRIFAQNIILFSPRTLGDAQSARSELRYQLGEPFLVGFDLSRKEKHETTWTSTVDPQEVYYLPRDRQGDPSRKYSMLDDIYSLGVLFIELALWRSFVSLPDKDQSSTPAKLQPAKGLTKKDSHEFLGPEDLYKRLVGFATKEVARSMGSIMSELIVSCLTCIEDPKAFGDRQVLEDQDGIVVGIAYIKRVLLALEEIRI